MPNPYLPEWEYIPDGEPRVFGDRVYIYGSHDHPNSEEFCDYKLKVWSASVDDLDHWVCHGDAFHTKADRDHESDTSWTGNRLFAPDVVEKDGKYYLYAYIVGAYGCVAVSDHPEGPFKVVSQYQSEETDIEDLKHRIMIDPGVLVDDDGRVYVYCGYLHSYMFEVNKDNMYEVLPGTYQKDFIPAEEPFRFFEACSPRKVNDLYYLIYSPQTTSQLVYATSKSPTGPFEYRGVIVDSGVDYPAGNNHGSICKIKDQWYVFYHRMTNNTCMSRRGCVERIEIKEDGTIEQVETTSLGFSESLSPYQETKAELACVLKGGCYVGEMSIFKRPIINLAGGSVIGYKYFDFGEDYSNTGVTLFVNQLGSGQVGNMHVHLDSEDGEIIGTGRITPNDSVLKINLPAITGRHAVYFTFETGMKSWIKNAFDGRELCKIESFIFAK